MNCKDYFFYINWEDTEKNRHRIGMLAQIENVYYLKMNSRENASSAYSSGCIGIPGFQNDRVYKSEELFDFFKRRILNKDAENLCEELKIDLGKSMTDSFVLEEIPEKLGERFKNIILEMFKNQEKMDKRIVSAHSL